MHSGVVFAVTAQDIEDLAAVRKYVAWQEATERGVRESLDTLRLRILDQLVADKGIVQACLSFVDGNDGRLKALATLCDIAEDEQCFDNRKNVLYDARDAIAHDFNLNLADQAPTFSFGTDGHYTPDFYVKITPANEPAVRRFLAALGCSEDDIDKIVSSGVMVVEAKCHCRWLVFWATEAAWTLKSLQLLKEYHGITAVVVFFSERSFTACLATDPSELDSYLRVVGRRQMQLGSHTADEALSMVNGKFTCKSQLDAHKAFEDAHDGIRMFDRHPAYGAAAGNRFTAAELVRPGATSLIGPLCRPLQEGSMFCDMEKPLPPGELAALVVQLSDYLPAHTQAALLKQPSYQEALAAPRAAGRAKLLREAIAARGARPTQSCRPLPARTEPRPLCPAPARCF